MRHAAAHLQRNLGHLPLVSDLYYSGFGGDEVLSKESNLAQAASQYKVSAAKIAADVKAELSAKRKRGKSNPGASNRAR